MPGYYMIHDKEFLKNADLSKFNDKILDLNLSNENKLLFNIIKTLPKNAIVLDIGAFKGDTSIFIAMKLNNIKRHDIKIICFEPNPNHCDNIIKHKEKYRLNI